MANPAVWFEIYVADMERATAFYQATLGVTLSRLDGPGPEMWVFPMGQEGYGATGALVRMPGMEPGGNSVVVYFGCDDCAVELARGIAAGGRLQRDKMSIGPHGFIALLNDSEGNLIGLHSMS